MVLRESILSFQLNQQQRSKVEAILVHISWQQMPSTPAFSLQQFFFVLK